MFEVEHKESKTSLPSKANMTFEGKEVDYLKIRYSSRVGDTACISDIFLHRTERAEELLRYIRGKSKASSDNSEFKEKLIIYPNMIEIRPTHPLDRSGNHGSTGKKDIIKEFSKKSRRGFIKFLCKIKDKLSLWQDITFADDVMQIKSERKGISNKALNRFRRIVLEKYPSIKIAYKREWEPRKSGKLKGEHVPHFHMFISVPNINEDHERFNLAAGLAEEWVGCTGTKEIHKALSVALHHKSYRIIKSQKQALKYATKYITKPRKNWTDESIGRSWGTIGKFHIAEPEIREMTPTEMVCIKRVLRKVAPKKHPIQKALRKKETPTFLIIKEDTLNRIIDHTQDRLQNESFNFIDSGISDSNNYKPNPSKFTPQEPIVQKGQLLYRLRRAEE